MAGGDYIKVGVLFFGYGVDAAEDKAKQQNLDTLGQWAEREGVDLADGALTHYATKIPPSLALRSNMDGKMTTEWRRNT